MRFASYIKQDNRVIFFACNVAGFELQLLCRARNWHRIRLHYNLQEVSPFRSAFLAAARSNRKNKTKIKRRLICLGALRGDRKMRI